MRVCPRCQGRYDDESRFCPRDGAVLPTPDADPRLGTVLLGQFELLEVCGRGAMGTVYRSWQSGMDREVAVKLLRTDYVKDPGIVKRFHREARSVARLNHPNVVTVFLVGETDDHVPFMVMEYVDGEPLSVEIARGEPLPVGRALRIARQIASALAEAHGNGIIHRDLKPANILLEQRRRATDVVKVVDFGIAKIVGGNDHLQPGESALTRTGTIFGTPHYLSPEQAQGATVDGRADLYSLGVVMFAMLTGRVPFEGSGMAVVVQHVNQAPPRPRELVPGMPAAVEALVLRLLEKDPAARPQAAEDVSDAIDGLLAQLGEAAAPMSRGESQPVPARAESQPSAPVRAVPSVTVKAGAVSPPGAPVGSVTVKGSPLLAPAAAHGLPPTGAVHGAPAAAAHGVTIKANALTPPAPGAIPPAVGVAPSALSMASPEATVPPPSMLRAAIVPEPRLSAETAYAMPGASALAAVQRAPAPMSPAVPASTVRPPSAVMVPAASPSTAPMSMEGGSDVWKPPSPWRRALLVLGVLLLLGGGAAAGVYALRRQENGALAGGPTPSGKGATDARVADAGNAASHTPPLTGADATPVPQVAGLPDGGAPSVPTRDEVVDAPARPPERVITLGEGGWAVRVVLPVSVVAGADVDLAVEAWEPGGKPVDAHELRMLVQEPSGLERSFTVPAVEQVGRFQLRRRFASPGRYQLRLFPSPGKSKPVVWFDLHVDNPDATGVMTRPEPARKTPVKPTAKPKSGSKKGKGAGGLGNPYHLLEESGGGDAAKSPPADKPPPPKDEPPPGKNGPAPKKDPPPPGDVELE